MLVGSFRDRRKDTNKRHVPRSNQANDRQDYEEAKQVLPFARTTPCRNFLLDDYWQIQVMVSFVKPMHVVSVASGPR